MPPTPEQVPVITSEFAAFRGVGLRARLLLMAFGVAIPPVLVSALLPLAEAGRSGWFWFLGAILLSITMAMLLGGFIARPVRALIRDAQALAAGVSGHRSRIQSSDEIGGLAQALNQMAETVERRNALLADSERRYRFLFESNPLPMWNWDADTLVILAVNEAAIEKYGYDRDAFLSRRITDLLDPAEMPRFSGARLPFSESRQSAGSWLHRTAAGQPIAMEVITTSSRRLGRASWLSVGIDVTARREAERALARSEAQLQQSQKMEAIGTFAGGISHDFNNLLTGMLGYCDLALLGLPSDSAVRGDLMEIRGLAVRGTDLTRQILSVSRRQDTQPVVVDPNTVVIGLDRLLRRVVGAPIEVHTRLDHSIGTVRVDVGQIEQVLLNLAINARDAMPDGGRLTIETASVTDVEAHRFGLDPRTTWTAIRIRDTGTGISDDVRQQIFEPFFTTKPAGKGTGLGLPLAYSLIDQAGGEIRLDSIEAIGTTFHIFLPQLDEDAAEQITAHEQPERWNGTETVLLAEDEDTVRSVATSALERRGYRVLAAADGESALAISRAYPGQIDLLLTDVVMPGMNGRTLAERMATMRPTMGLLFTSGYSADEATIDPRALLQKPFTALDLSRRVRMALDARAGVVPDRAAR